MKRLLLGCAALLGVTAATALPATAQLRITVTEGTTEAMPIAIPDFEIGGGAASDPQMQKAASDMASVIRADLESSGLFRALDPESFIQQDVSLDFVPVFADWRVIKSDALVVGRVTPQAEDKILVEFRLFDVFGAEQLAGMRFVTPRENWRRIAHKVADAVYAQLTGETGYFDSRIAYIAESGPKTNRRKRLALMDQDGANKVLLPAGSDLVLTPRFDPASQTLTYLSYEDVVPKVYMYDIASNRRELLGQFPGMTYAPRFSPDGKQMLLTIDKGNNSDIYVMDLQSRSTKRLTTNPADDLSASFAPDMKRVVFNSNRGGKAQLYTMNPDGSDVKRISFGKGRYTAPVWSPRGDLIAFTRQLDGKFAIGVMDPDGKNERILSEAWGNEGPTWSPNGRVVMFFRSERGSGAAKLYAVDVTGRNLRMVETGGNASDPAWSALLD